MEEADGVVGVVLVELDAGSVGAYVAGANRNSGLQLQQLDLLHLEN